MKHVAWAAVFVTGLTGCIGSNSEKETPSPVEKVTGIRAFEWSEVMDAVWEVVEKDKHVWLDDIQLAEGELLDLKLKALDPKSTMTGAKHGVVLNCHVRGTDVRAMTAFRRELKQHPTLSRHFSIMNFDVSWRVVDQPEFAEKHSLDFKVIMVSKG